MIIVSFNINGIRSHINQLEKIIKLYNPFIIALQETKIGNDIFPKNFFLKYGYHVYFNGYKNHYGVALASKIKINNIYFNFFNEEDFKYRIIIGEFYINSKNIIIINIYTPQGESLYNTTKFNQKKLFINNLIKYISNIINNNNLYILILGDINICPNYIDIGLNYYTIINWIKNKKCSFLKEEIYLFKKIIKNGIIDIFRNLYPKLKKFTWFGYNKYNNNEGLRLDMFLSNKNIYNISNSSGMYYNIRSMIKPSDHVPIWLDLNI